MAGRGGSQAAEKPAAWSRPDGGGSGFSPAVFLAGWAGGELDRAQLPTEGTPLRHTHSQNVYSGRLPSTSHPQTLQAEGESGFSPWLGNSFGLLETIAEFL